MPKSLPACLPYAVALLFLLPPVVAMQGCGSAGGRAYSPDLSDNYLYAVAPAAWYKRVVTYDIRGGDSQVPFVDMPRTVERGIHRWDGFPGLPAFVKSAPGATADVVITFGRPGEVDHRHGQATPVVDDTRRPGAIGSASIIFNRSILPSQLEVAAAHEWGHVLGLRGESDQPGDLMNGANLPANPRPGTRDYATVVLIYKMLGEQ